MNKTRRQVGAKDGLLCQLLGQQSKVQTTCTEELLVGELGVSESSSQVPNYKYMVPMNKNPQAVLEINLHGVPFCARSNLLFLMWQDP